MKWDSNKQITTVIIIAIIMFGLFFIALAVGTWNFEYTININMDNNTTEGVKSIDWKNITK